MINNHKRDYVVKGNKLLRPLPPIGYNHEEEEAQLYFQQIIRGNINVDQISDPQPREVRIFLSSTFSDFKLERNLIIKKVLPEIKATCNMYGLDLRFCDMRWGVTDSAVNEHLVEKLCIKEIEMCRKNSIGPFFVLLIGNRYGYKPIPSELPSTEFEMLLRIIVDKCPKEIEIFTKWFKKDENAQPPVHLLLPIKSHLPNYTDYNDDVKRRESGNEWWSVEERIRRTLYKVSHLACLSGEMTIERRRQLIRSVTETELWSALIKNNIEIDKREVERCLAYERQLNGLADDLQSEIALKYIDCVMVDGVMVCENECLAALNDFKKSLKKISLKNYRQYSTPWSSCGICEDIVTHQHYLDKLCKHMTSDLKNLIISRMAALEKFTNRFDKAKNYLQSEIINQWLFSRQRSRMFCGRRDQLKAVFKFIATEYRFPIIIHGDSGSGKTAFLSKIAFHLQSESLKLSNDQYSELEHSSSCFTNNQSPVIIIRCLGTSASSSTLQQLLFSVCFQIQVAYKMKVQFRKMTSLSSLQWLFNHLLLMVSCKFSIQMPLVIILDSLDQLLVPSAGLNNYQKYHLSFSWIPTETPPGVHLILSLATDSTKMVLFENLSARLSSSNGNFIEISCFEKNEIYSIFQAMQQFRGRRLTQRQMDLVMDVLTKNPQALFIKITLEETLNWTSFLQESEWIVANTIESAVQLMFSKLENRYGIVLIRFTLGYLTLGLNGLSELELEDLLSLQDDVLNEIYQYHDPPLKGIIRLPSLLWARIHSDLSAYIVEKRTDGKLTMSWYHRHFYQCALNRYVLKPNLSRQLHTEIANYFSMTSSCFKTCELKNSKRYLEIKDANRLITASPISNRQPRKLHALSYHLIESGQDHMFAEKCVANLHYLTCFLQCFGIQELILWLKSCSQIFADNHVIKIIKNCVSFIETLLESSPQDLAAQLLGQLHHLDKLILNMDCELYSSTISIIQSLCSQCKSTLSMTSSLIPSIACFPSSLGSIKLYKENIEKINKIPWNSSLIILIGQLGHEWIVRLFQSNDRVSLCSITCENKPYAVAIPSFNQSYIFIQDFKHVYMFDVDTGQLEAKHSVFINNKIMLNECMAVDPHGRWIAIAAQNRIALLEYRPSTPDKMALVHKSILTAREVDKTISMCFIQHDKHSLLLTAHNYNSKMLKTFLIKLWQYEQNNELWTLDLATISSKYWDSVSLWPIPQSSNLLGPNQIGSTLIVLPNGSCYQIDNIFESKSMKVLLRSDSGKQCKEKLQSLTSDNDTVTITRVSGKNTLISTISKNGDVIHVEIPCYIPQRSVTSAIINTSTKSMLLGLKSGNIFYIHENESISWRAHRSPITHLECLSNESEDLLKIITYSFKENVVKCWTKNVDPLKTEEKFAKTIFEDMNAFCFSKIKNSFVIVDSNFSVLHCGTLDSFPMNIRCLPLTIPSTPLKNTEMDLESMLVMDMELVLNDQGVLIFFDNRIQLYNITKPELISSMELSCKPNERSQETLQRNYWFVVEDSTSLFLLTYDTPSGYFKLECRYLPSIFNIRSTKTFLSPLNINQPQSQLDKIALISTCRKKYLIILWKVNRLFTDITNQDSNLIKVKDYTLSSSLNLRDSSQTLCLNSCSNSEETKKTQLSRKVTSKTSNQPMFSYAKPQQIPENFPRELFSESTILIGGIGEILIWDLDSGSCRIPKVANFHTWFKHSLTVNMNTDVAYNSEMSSLRSDSRRFSIRSLSESNPKEFQKLPITALLISRESVLVVSGCSGGFIIVWRWADTISLCGNIPDPVNLYRIILSSKHAAQVNCLALSEDSRLLASGSADMTLYLFDISHNTCLNKVNIHCSPLTLSFCDNKETETELSKTYLLCQSVYIGQSRMMLFDVDLK